MALQLTANTPPRLCAFETPANAHAEIRNPTAAATVARVLFTPEERAWKSPTGP